MSKIAFIFPGQGAQYIGMAKDFYDQRPECKEVFDIATRELDIDMAKLCFVENDNLNKTEYTQAAMLTACISILRAVEEILKPDMTAGLSLGEYSALVANGILSFEDAIKIVRKRGCFMEHEVPDKKGTMAAVLGMDSDKIESICKSVSKETGQPVEPANYNCPGQIVISGEKNAVLEANKKLAEAGAKRVLELKVSGPFHSIMLKGAGDKLAEVLKNVELKVSQIPYVTNVTAEVITEQTDRNEIRILLEKQVYSPVKWQQCIEKMIEEGVDTFVEIGPGKTLSGFLKKIDRSKTIINIEKIEDLEKISQIN